MTEVCRINSNTMSEIELDHPGLLTPHPGGGGGPSGKTYLHIHNTKNKILIKLISNDGQDIIDDETIVNLNIQLDDPEKPVLCWGGPLGTIELHHTHEITVIDSPV
jgi:hypothetical protein